MKIYMEIARFRDGLEILFRERMNGLLRYEVF